MEQALSADDPRLVSALSASPKMAGAGILRGLLLVLVGIIVLFAGLISQVVPVGVAGFVIALAGLLIAIRGVTSPVAKAPKGAKAKGGFGTRLENRWDQRNQG
jgi:uncharacterized membrane protein HdeD (DUF308 family)